MDGKSSLRVLQFCIEDGKRQLYPINVGRVDASSQKSRRSRGDLYVLLESPQGSRLPDALCHQLIESITDTYYGTAGSITRGLREAVMAANQMLFEGNLRKDIERSCIAGINCVVVREGDAYVAQLGPALASFISQGEVVRYPADSIWLRTASPSPFDQHVAPPAGLRRDVEPDLFHTRLSPGDLLVLSSTGLARTASAQDLASAVAGRVGSALRSSIEGLAQGGDLTVLVIECPEPPEAAEAEGQRPAQSEAEEPPLEGMAPPDLGIPPRQTTDTAGEGQVVMPTFPPMPRQPAEHREEPEGERASLPREGRPAVGEPKPAPLADLKKWSSGLSDGVRKARRSTEEFLVRVLPDVPSEPRPSVGRGDEPISLSGRAFVVVVLLVPFVMLFLVVMARLQYDRTQKGYLERAKTEALSQYEMATSQENRTVMREGLYRALASAEEALAVDPNDETMQTLKRRISHKLDGVDVVDRLYHFWQLAVLDDGFGGPTDSVHIIVRGVDLFLLNRASDQVYKFLLNDVGDALQPVDRDPVLAGKGQHRGGIEIGEIVDIAWLEAGGQRSLSTFVALERGGSLLAYDPQQGIDVLPVADSAAWSKPQAIGGYFGNLYVLDPLLNRILKYVPTDNAYTNPPSDYLSPQFEVDLTGAVDMAIDGNLYLLFADGRIQKFFNGEPQPFSMDGLPTGMRSPTTIIVSGPQDPEAPGYVYVTDAGNERIVQFTKDGGFVRQLQAKEGEPQLRDLRGVYVDEESGRVFIVSGNTLWLADIPPLSGG